MARNNGEVHQNEMNESISRPSFGTNAVSADYPEMLYGFAVVVSNRLQPTRGSTDGVEPSPANRRE